MIEPNFATRFCLVYKTAEQFADANEEESRTTDTGWMYNRICDLPQEWHSSLIDCGQLQGWYWFCLSASMKRTTEAFGPFKSSKEAFDDAESYAGDGGQ